MDYFYCPHCEVQISRDGLDTGLTVACSTCEQLVTVPDPLPEPVDLLVETLMQFGFMTDVQIRTAWRKFRRIRYENLPEPPYPEVWRPVERPLFKETHMVSNWGRVKHNRRGKPLTPDFNHEYLRVLMYYDESTEDQACIHVLVAEAFIGRIREGYVVDHKDQNKHNPAIHNLQIITDNENSARAYKAR